MTSKSMTPMNAHHPSESLWIVGIVSMKNNNIMNTKMVIALRKSFKSFIGYWNWKRKPKTLIKLMETGVGDKNNKSSQPSSSGAPVTMEMFFHCTSSEQSALRRCVYSGVIRFSWPKSISSVSPQHCCHSVRHHQSIFAKSSVRRLCSTETWPFYGCYDIVCANGCLFEWAWEWLQRSCASHMSGSSRHVGPHMNSLLLTNLADDR